jgi:N-methylhydantoinase A
VQRLKQLGVRSIAVMYLFSFVNPEHERRTREIVLEEFPDVDHISLSHEVMPRGPEFERVSTTLVNAYVAPRIANYTANLQDKLRRAGYGGPLLIMQSTGGVMPPDYVARRAVTLLASGPTGGVMGATVTAADADIGDFIAVDMGGTSFDICLVRSGRPEIKTDWNWRYRYYIGLPMVAVRSRACAKARYSSVRSPRAPRRDLCVTAGAARAPRSPMPMPCSAISPSTVSRAAACVSTSTRRAPRSCTTSPSRSTSTSPRRRGASSAS